MGGVRASYTLRHLVHVTIDCGFGNWVYSSAPTITQTRSKKDVVAGQEFPTIVLYPHRPGAKLLFFFKFNAVRSERDVVAVASFSNFKSLKTQSSFDIHKIPAYQQTPTNQLLAALIWKFKIEILQLQIALHPLEF